VPEGARHKHGAGHEHKHPEPEAQTHHEHPAQAPAQPSTSQHQHDMPQTQQTQKPAQPEHKHERAGQEHYHAEQTQKPGEMAGHDMSGRELGACWLGFDHSDRVVRTSSFSIRQAKTKKRKGWSKFMKYLLTSIGVLLVLAVARVSISAQEVIQSNASAQSLTLKDLKGQEQSLGQHRGKIVVLNFWATWCIPCREEMPMLVGLQQRYKAQGIEVIGVSADEASTRKAIPSFARKQKIEFPIWIGGTTTDMQRLGLGEALPATAIIDRDGQIVGRILGPVEKDDLEKRIQWLLGDRQSPAPQPIANNIEKLKQNHAAHKHEHEDRDEHHQHGGVGVEGASTVPS